TWPGDFPSGRGARRVMLGVMPAPRTSSAPIRLQMLLAKHSENDVAMALHRTRDSEHGLEQLFGHVGGMTPVAQIGDPSPLALDAPVRVGKVLLGLLQVRQLHFAIHARRSRRRSPRMRQ